MLKYTNTTNPNNELVSIIVLTIMTERERGKRYQNMSG